MRILIYSDYFRKKSGYAREMADLIPYFQAAGHQIGYVALGYTGLPLDPDKEIEIYPGNIVIDRGPLMDARFSDSYYAPEVLDYAIDDFKPDIVFTRIDYFALRKIGLVLSRPRGFHWVHWGVVDGDPLGKNTSEPLKWIHEHLVSSEYAKRIVESESNAKCDIVMPPINPVTWDKIRREDWGNLPEFRAKKRKEKGIPVSEYTQFIACVARNQRRKNLPVLFEAVKVLKSKGESPLLFLVSHAPKTVSGDTNVYDLDHLIQYFGLEENVFVAGRSDGKVLHDEAVAEIYQMADVFALPTMGEGFGLIFGEAMYAGLPIVTTDYSACSEIVGAERGVLVKPCGYSWDLDDSREAVVDAEEFATGIIEGINMGKTSSEQSESSRKFVEELTPEKVSNKILASFEKVHGTPFQQPILK